MTKTILLFSILFSSKGFSQNIDVIKSFEEAKSDSARMEVMDQIYGQSDQFSPDSMKYYYIQFKTISQRQNDKAAEAVNMACMGYYLQLCGELPQGLQLLTLALHMAEPTRNARALGMINFWLQYFTNDRDKKISLIRKAITFSKEANDNFFLQAEYRHLGVHYRSLKNYDSAFYYMLAAYNLSRKTQESDQIIYNLGGLGSLHDSVGDKAIALQYYRAAAEIKTDNIHARTNPYRPLAIFFKKEDKIDSCIHYAKKGYDMISSTPYLQPIIAFSKILKDAYKGLNSDSALKYTDIYYAAMDSMYGRKKIEQIQALNFDEDIRQQKIEEEKLKASEQRKHNLQYAGIALGLITFIVLFLFFSHSIIANEKLIRFLGVLALLIVFEFINLFIHPYISRVSNSSPVVMLLVMVCIAALLIPLHHSLEKLVTHRLVEKNKKIRLAAAKKTIAKLEGEQTN